MADILPGLFGPSSLPSSPTSQQTSTGTNTNTTNQTTTGNIAPWAQPYVSDYLNRSQSLIANQQTPALLNQSYAGAANLRMPTAFATGEDLASKGGYGNLSTAPIALGYGAQGAEYGAQGTKYGEMGSAMGTAASRAGDLYAQQATSPQAMAQYMSPYMNNVVDWQKEQAIRDYQIQAPQMAAQAVGSGAFGGNRLALQQSEANRGLQNRLAGIEATGQQQAYQNAQQAQQFGSTLGLQGLQAGMQGQQVGLAGLGTAMQGQQIGLQGVSGAQQGYSGATQAGGTLGNIGAQEAAAKLGILNLQNQFGLQQQNFPYQQLQFAKDQMAGLPLSSQTSMGTSAGTQQGTQQGTQAGSNPLSQIAGLGTAAIGGTLLYNNLFKAGGGLIKNYASGGLVTLALDRAMRGAA